MRMTTAQVEARVPVTVMALHGDLDGSSYQDAIDEAKSLYDRGVRYIILDLSDVPYMSSAGLVALHSIATLLRGEEPPDPEMGWAAFHTVDLDRDKGLQRNLKLLNPQPRVERVLETVGFKSVFEIYTDLQDAAASF